MRSRRNRRSSSKIEQPILTGLACSVLILALLLGGAPNRLGLRFDVVVMSGAILVGCAFWNGGLKAFQKVHFWCRFWLVLLITLPLVQLIPLPPFIWQSFPGRERAAEVFDLVGAGRQYHALSLDPIATLTAWLALVPAVGVFLAAITLSARDRRYLGLAILGIACVAIAAGLFQFGSRGTIFNFYDSSHRQYLLGFFANRNHQALFLCISLIFLTFFLETGRYNAQHIKLILSLGVLLVGGAVLATFSRSGVALFVLVTVFLGFRVFGQGRGKVFGLILAAGALLLAVVLLSANDVISDFLARYGSVGDDERWNFWVVSWRIAADSFPVGTGLGTFVPIYAAYEPLDLLNPRYVNHAHNDYLELLVETGAAGGFLVLFGVVLFAQGVIRLRPWSKVVPSGVLLAIPLIVSFHSLVDYPLRTIAISCAVAFALAEIAARWRAETSDIRS